MTILVTGFGPFPGVEQNPTEALARSIHGTRVGSEDVVGVVLPVAYEDAVSQTLALARTLDATWVIGTGVAVRRARIGVEQWGRRVVPSRPDVHGLLMKPEPGPIRRRATVDVPALADVLGGEVSEDAGAYVCNAWLYGVLGACPCPATFVHVPVGGVDVDMFLKALGTLKRCARSSDCEVD